MLLIHVHFALLDLQETNLKLIKNIKPEENSFNTKNNVEFIIDFVHSEMNLARA